MSEEEIKEDINEDINEVFDIYIQNQQLKNKLRKAVDINISLQNELQQKENIIKEVREEIRMLESNCDISDYQAQKLYQLLDKGE